MHWDGAGEENIKALRRIMALLLALAGLAERASGRSRPVRYLVLWLLRPAEEIVRDYVVGLTLDPNWTALHAQATSRFDDDSADEALRLALSFRALAAVLAALTDEASPSWRAHLAPALCIGLARCAAGALAALLVLPAAPAVGRRDSS